MRTPIIAPAPIIRMSDWKPSVRPSHLAFQSNLFPQRSGSPKVSGTSVLAILGPPMKPVTPLRSLMAPAALAP